MKAYISGKITGMPFNGGTYECSSCGTILDRDYNASLNIRNEGMRIAFA